MPSRSGEKSNQILIPIGLVLLAVGMAIIIAVLGVWAYAVYQSPAVIEQLRLQVPPAQPTAIEASLMTPTPASDFVGEQMPKKQKVLFEGPYITI